MPFRSVRHVLALGTRGGVTAAVGAVLGATVAACAASSPVPPKDDPYFPAAIAVTADEATLFIANANSDLRYGAAALQSWDVARIAAMVAEWKGGQAGGALPAGCEAQADRPWEALCRSRDASGQSAGYVLPGAVQIGNFASSLAIQELDAGHDRVFLTVRGDPSVTWVDHDRAARALDCGGSGSFPRCDERHRLDTFRNDETLGALFSEPFSVGIDGPGETAVVTHLTSGRVTLVSAPLDPGQAPRLEDSLTGLWSPNGSGVISAVSVAPRLPGDPSGLYYVTSRSESRVNVVRAVPVTAVEGSPSSPLARLVSAGSFFTAPGPGIGGLAADARGLAFSPDGSRAYIVGRNPAELMVLDTSLDADGSPRNQMLGHVEICEKPSEVAVADLGTGGPLAYVPCFGTGETWVVDTERFALVDRVAVGRGPAAIALAASTHHVGFVANYADDTISVIDLDPQSATFNQAVLTLGNPRQEQQ